VANEVVRGIEALDRAFALAGNNMRKDLPRILRSKAAPVERAAEGNALAIGSGVPWSEMRVGSTRHMVYVSPFQRGTKLLQRKRPKFAARLLQRAMLPALNSQREQVAQAVDELLARLERQFNRG